MVLSDAYISLENRLLKVNALNIWPHQKDAIREIAHYFVNFDNKAFLIKMPTGTGKTGVFACLSRIAYPDKNFIIITPSTALKEQIVRELKSDFWTKIGYSLQTLESQVIEPLLPTTAEEVLEKIKGNRFIIVTTIQTLQALGSTEKYNDIFELLQAESDYLVFDEGHKEPALTWGDTVRSFGKPTILFSATPYRNDYKIFNIDKEKFYSLEHSFCENQNILRKIKIRPIPPSRNHQDFVANLLKEIESISSVLANQGIKKPKTIIRCEKSDDIEKIVGALKSARKTVIGIHETFKNYKNFTKDVPDSDDQKKYDFFVHQYKLIEGIDNPDFCIVVLFADFGSTRMLIQQIGRILRNPERKPDQVAFLFSGNVSKTSEEWKKYLTYDQLIDTRKKLFDITDILKVNKEASTLYFSGAFRDLVDVNNISLTESLLFQKKINAYENDGSITFKAMSELVLEEWNRRDYYILKHEIPETNTLLILYIKYENSPLVKDGIFIEQTLALTFLKFYKDRVLYYDSIQNSQMRQIEALSPITRESLIKLFKDKRSISKIYLLNTDVGRASVRSKELQANSVEDTAPGLSDHSYFPSRLEGYVDGDLETKKRYIGFQNGRITDFSNRRIEYSDFQKWLNEVMLELDAVLGYVEMSGFLNRFAEKVDPPKNTNAASILLDISNEILFQYKIGESLESIFIDTLCVDVKENVFVVEVNKKEFKIDIRYLKDKNKYLLSSYELDSAITNSNSKEPSLLEHLNTQQSFRIVLEGNQHVYAYKNFFRPGLNLISKNKDLDINQLFHPHKCISKIASEKGSEILPVADNLWHTDTLFGLIARRGKGYGDIDLENQFDFDYLLCDDLNGELGDFIALNSVTKKVVFIHAKAKDAKLSATAFTEICGQATKNLDYLTPYFEKNPTNNINKWKKPWSISKIGTVSNRMIVGSATPKKLWDKYNAIISNPSATREVWLFVGNMFDYGAFNKELNKAKIEDVKPEIIQLVYLLRSTWNSVSSVGAQLKIFC